LGDYFWLGLENLLTWFGRRLLAGRPRQPLARLGRWFQTWLGSWLLARLGRWLLLWFGRWLLGRLGRSLLAWFGKWPLGKAWKMASDVAWKMASG
jgi:hypothetical protein